MSRRRLFLTGGSGLLGSAIIDRWLPRWDITALARGWRVSRPGVTNVSGDLLAPATLGGILERAEPDVVVHAAAWTDLDACEESPAQALALHRDATAALAQAAARAKARFVYISTDSVFSGVPGPHSEEDPAAPLSVYARTKLQGELASLAAYPSSLIVRTCIVGWNAQPKTSFVEWILRELRGGQPINAFSDVSFTPILSNTLAMALEALASTDAVGVLHVGGAECISKFAYAKMVAEIFGLPAHLIKPSSIACASLRAPRPTAPCLDSNRFARLTGTRLETVEAQLQEMKRLEADDWPLRTRKTLERA